MLKKKRAHHYVWQHYLKPWTKNNLIWCYRNGSIFKSKTEGIAQERDFYKTHKLNEEEISFIHQFANMATSEHLKKTNIGFLKMHTQIFKMKKIINENYKINEYFDDYIDTLIHNFQEDYHTKIESNGINFLNLIKNDDISFYNDEIQCLEFIFFLCTQYMRTKRMKETAIKNSPKYKNIIENSWPIFSQIAASNIGASFFIERHNTQLILLTNSSKTKFITGDQPAVNTYAKNNKTHYERHELEIYYPISPQKAILLSQKKQNIKQEISEQKATELNNLIFQQSLEKIYSDSDLLLKQITKKP